MKHLTFTSYFAFCGSGGGAYGFQKASTHLLDHRVQFEVLGGFDVDPKAVQNFHYVTGVPALLANVRELTPEKLQASARGINPDAVFNSAPCVGATKLVTDELAATDHYVGMNELMLVWTKLLLATWKPRLLIYENVPNVVHRAKGVLRETFAMLRDDGYLVHDDLHELGEWSPDEMPGGFIEHGELGGLAEKRKRWLAVARHPDRCAPLLFKPVKRRIKGVGEVIGPLPLPGDTEAGGPMHVMPNITTMNLARLALIPAGGDHRDIPGVLAAEQARREVFRRMHVQKWNEPCVTVGGPGGNGPYAVCDPRVGNAFKDAYGVGRWTDPAATVTGEAKPSNGRFAVADPRLKCKPFAGAYGVNEWGKPAATVVSMGQIDNARVAVADPRAGGFRGTLGVVQWDEAMGTVTGAANRPQSGSFSVADPRVPRAFDKGYAVVGWGDPTNTIAGNTAVGCGTYSVADPRITKAPPGWLTVDDVMVFFETVGPWAIVDRDSDGPPLAIIQRLDRPPPIPLRILARDGTWHRPFTRYELAVIQGMPAHLHGKPLAFCGPATADLEQIGNMVPAPSACAMGEQFLLALAQNELGTFSLSGGGGVWVDSPDASMALQ